MTTVLIIVVVAVGVFVTAFISPKHGTRAQRLSARWLHKAKRSVSSWPKVMRKMVKTPSAMSDKTIQKSAKAGKKSHRKVTGD